MVGYGNKQVVTALLLLLLAVVSCTGGWEEQPQHYVNPAEKPYFYSSLIQALNQGKWYVGAEDATDYAIIRLSDDTIINLPYSELKIFDGNLFDEPNLFYEEDTHLWRMNLVDTGLYYEDVPDSASYPLCIWYDNNIIRIYLCNGSQIVRSHNPSDAFKSFTISKEDNTGIIEDIVCTVDGDRIIGNHPASYYSLRYKPRFEFDAVKVYVDGKEQTSGKDTHDFSNPVVYELELFDGSRVTFTVQLKSPNDFPTVYLFTDSYRQINDKVNYIPGHIRIEDPRKEYSDVDILDADMKIKGRGNSTWSFFPKKPYHIKLDQKSSVYGLHSNKDWIVMANYNDKSLLRNEVAFQLSRICNLSWTPSFYPAEVYLNGTYLGLYEFGEHKEVAKHKVNIDVENGDYYLELECYPDEAAYFWTSMQVPLTYKDPDNPTQEQRYDLEGFFEKFETALQSDYFADPTKGYAAYIDVKSFIDNYIIQELTKNFDGNLHKSTFFTKTKNGKLEFYHVWDFDLSLGNCSFFPGEVGNGPENFYVKYYGFQGYGWGWYYRLFQDNIFKKKVKNRWNELKPALDTIPDFIDTREKYIQSAAERNFKKWNILRQNVWSQCVIPGSFHGEVEYLKEFYKERLDWLDKEINKW